MVFFGLCMAYAMQSAFQSRPQGLRGDDFRWLYVAGTCWKQGLSPYHLDSWLDCWNAKLPFMDVNAELGAPIIPTCAPIAVPLAYLPYFAARLIFALINVLALAACLAFTAGLLKDGCGVSWRTPGLWIGLGFGCLIGGVSAAIYVGQPTLLALAGSLGAIYYWGRDRTIPFAFCVALASLKAPVSLLPLLFVFAGGGVRKILAGTVLVAGISAVVIASSPLDGLISDMQASVAGYAKGPANKPPRASGLYSLFAGTPLEVSMPIWAFVGMGLVVVLAVWDRRRAGSPAGVVSPGAIAMTFAASGVFIQLKEYDSSIFLPVVAYLACAGRVQFLLAGPGLLLACRPSNISNALAKLNHGDIMLSASHVMTIGAVYLLIVLALFGHSSKGAFCFSIPTSSRFSFMNGGDRGRRIRP